MNLKFGLSPFVPSPSDFLFRKYLKPADLPELPETFGFEDAYPRGGWGMLGNDVAGNCVWAGAAHETMLWNKANGRSVEFDTECVLSDYSACTGYDPDDPSSDNGTDMRAAMKYRQEIGCVDTAGNRHKIGAYMLMDRGDLSDLYYAIHLLGIAAIGFYVPASAMVQFERGNPWDVRPLQPVEGGHYVSGVARRKNIEVVTWGRLQAMTPRFYRRYDMMGYVIFSEEWLRDGKSPHGFDRELLLHDLKEIGK